MKASHSKTFYHGNLREESLAGQEQHWGWVVGEFFEVEGDARLNKDLEVKYWEFKMGDNSGHEALKASRTLEWTYILKGKVKSIVDGSKFTMRAGEYVIIHPNTPNNLVNEVLEDSAGITVKAPSDKDSKRILD